MIRNEIKNIVDSAVKSLRLGDFNMSEIIVGVPARKGFGEYFTNAPHVIAGRPNKPIDEKDIRRIAPLLKSEIEKIMGPEIDKVEDIGGFINFHLSKEYLIGQLQVVLKEKNKFGSSKIGNGKKVNVEFVSANPTGPLTLGNGRGGFGGDVLANVLGKSGYKVAREYYINDTGAQIKKLGHSVIGDQEAVYKGKYIDELRKKVKGKNPEEVGEKAGKIILEKMIKPSVKKIGIKFDKWFSETTLYKNGEVDKAIAELTKKGFTYKSEGALWFKSKDLGDDKDRVLIRADGIKTYFASDIAYLKNKFKRGFEKLIIFLGADHYGYVARLKAASHALGYRKEDIDAIVLQLVKLFENGKEARMSKRTGIYVTIDELIDEVGLDVARFFFLQRALNTHFNFDMDLAKEKSEKNPVFKVQYAYARICSIFRKFGKSKFTNPDFKLLKESTELELLKQIIRLPEIVEDTTKDYQLQRLPNYALELAESFHKFYENCQVISQDKKIAEARLSLILAVKISLKNTLELMGINAPEKM